MLDGASHPVLGPSHLLPFKKILFFIGGLGGIGTRQPIVLRRAPSPFYNIGSRTILKLVPIQVLCISVEFPVGKFYLLC